MPSGRVKIYDPTRGFGFLVNDDGYEVFVPSDVVDGTLRSGDLVEYEAGEGESGRTAVTSITVTKAAPADSPVGRTLAAPPSWDQLEEVDRQRRAARRRRR